MRSITISTNVFARIWSLRQAGEDTEDAILSRVLACPGSPDAETSSVASTGSGLLDARSDVLFPEGFEVFRVYLGAEYKARVLDGKWVLENDGRIFQSLNELSRAIGAKTENAWLNWFYLDDRGVRLPASKLRNPNVIATRSRQKETAIENPVVQKIPPVEGQYSAAVGDGTWRDDVRASLQRLGGRSSLFRIYKEVEAVRTAAGRSVPPSLEATVRRTLEDHSSDSENYRGGPDLFCVPEGKGAGVWGLR
jgi:hypothetical protein